MEKGENTDRKRIGAVIQAAGGGARFQHQTHKLMMELNGKTILQHAISLAQDALLDPIVVVLGAHYPEIAERIKDESVIIVENPQWQCGQSTSLRKGIEALPPGISAACLMLGDQPRVKVATIHRLVGESVASPNQIIVPIYQGKRGNPTIFPQIYFDELISQETSDLGGRALLQKYGAKLIAVNDPLIIRDIDTFAEYEAYRKLFDQE